MGGGKSIIDVDVAVLSKRLGEFLFVRFFAGKCSLVLTNVPGPREHLHLAGHRIERVMFWVPQSGGLGVGVSVLSYAGSVYVGVMTDAEVIDEPRILVQAFEEELHALGRALGVAAANSARQPRSAAC